MRRLLGGCLLVLVTMLAAGCGDDGSPTDDPSDDSSPTATSTRDGSDTMTPNESPGTTTSDGVGDDGGDTNGGESDDDGHSDGGPVEPLLDVAAGELLGHRPGADADVVIDDLLARLGPPQYDSGWGPTECPPADRARSLSWAGFHAYFSDVDRPSFDGTRLHAEAAGDLAAAVVFPAGIEWGTSIDDVAAQHGAVAEYSEGFGWWEVWVEDGDFPRSFVSESDGPLDGVMVGHVPRCS